MAAHHHDRRGIYRCALLRFRGRIEIDHSYGLRCRGLCCHSRHSTRGAGRRGRKRPRDGWLHLCCAGSGSTNHSSADRIVVNSYNHVHTPTQSLCQSTECFIVKQFLDLRLYLCLFRCDVYFLMSLWSK